MSVAEKLSYSLGLKDQTANRKLAQEIVDAGDRNALQELIQLFEESRPKRMLMDAILTISAIGEKGPKMLLPHFDFLIEKLSDKISRVSWGSMIALAHLSPHASDRLYQNLPRVLDAMAGSSIVARDHGFRILVELYQVEKYQENLFFVILEQLRMAPSNQLGQYTERFLPVMSLEHRKGTIEVLEERRRELENEHHLKRLDKNLKKLYHDRVE